MPEISVTRLRSFHDQSVAAYAALRAAGERVRYARSELQMARDTLRMFMDSHTVQSRPGKDDLGREQARLEREVKSKATAVEAAEAARADAHERSTLAGSLASRGREYAAALGQLPADLVDF